MESERPNQGSEKNIIEKKLTLVATVRGANNDEQENFGSTG